MNVAAIVNKDAATVEDAKPWVRAMKEKGRWSDGAARKRLVALEALTSVLGSEESRAAKDVLASADVLKRRWAIGKNADGDTASDYGSSVKSTLKLYLDYLDDPAKAWASFEAKPKRTRKPTESAGVEKGSTTAEEQQTAVQHTTAGRGELRTFPLDNGRVVEFRIPPELSVRELAKFSCHVATLCKDFDPT
ncbi:MAG TPA: hypothetical protein VEP66_20125, partial [Myxococcales bacterium]|nr:hypothetical protein [Myxococcales bacterium]